MGSYPRRLSHEIPSWVEPGSWYHIRIRTNGTNITTPSLASKLLEAAGNYHKQQCWHSCIFLIMPDHLHAILAFPGMPGMTKTIGYWKRYTAKVFGISWQENYFDHRLRNENERESKAGYILNNPVVKGLCSKPEDWPWVLRGGN